MSTLSQPVPVTIVSGFLGAGKTTIIANMIDYLLSQKQTPIFIKNELGSENLDAQLLQGKNIQTKELLNGCICCTLVGPFWQAIEEIIENYQPDRIIIEASGAADPSAIALMVASHPKLMRDTVISIIDVLNFEGYHDISTTAQRQAMFTDLIVFNKVEEAPLEQKQRVVGYVRELNQFAPIVEAPHGVLDPRLAFGTAVHELASLLEKETAHEHHHLDDDRMNSISIQFSSPPDKQVLTEKLSHLPAGVIRVKGVVRTTDNQRWLVNRVAQRLELQPAPENLPSTYDQVLVLIGFDIKQQETALQAQLGVNSNS